MRDAEAAGLLRLAQAGHQRGRGRIAPDQDQGPPIAIDAAIGKRGFVTEIEQAAVDPPLRRLLRHIGHRADFGRQPKIQSASLEDHAAGHRDQDHRRTQPGDLELARPAGANRQFDKAIGQPGQCDAEPDNQTALQQRQRREFDDREEHQ